MTLFGKLLPYNRIMPDGRAIVYGACDKQNNELVPVLHNGKPIGICKLRCEEDGVYFSFSPNNSPTWRNEIYSQSFLTDWFLKKRQYSIAPHIRVISCHKKSAKVLKKIRVIMCTWTEKKLPGNCINEIVT